jgi:hypothetical protein
MGKITVKHTEKYSIIANEVAQNKELSLKAKGLFLYMWSLPDDWDYSVQGLIACLKEGRDAIQSGLKELEQTGYLVREQKRDGGKFDYDYILSDMLPQTGFPFTANPSTGNQLQQITNKQSTKEEKTIPKGIGEQAPKKSYKDVYSALENIKVRDALVKFVNSCKGKRYNPKVETVEKFASDLREYSSNDPDMAMRIVDYCIAQGWKAIYPPKDKALLQAVSVNKKQTYATDGDGNLLVF